MIKEKDINKLKNLGEKDQIKVVRSLPWSMKKKVWKLIAKAQPTEKIKEIIDTLNYWIKTDPDRAKKQNYQRDLETLIKFARKYKK